MALTVNLNELKKDFRIYGVLRGIDSFEQLPFQKGVDYFGFIIKRKNVTLKHEAGKKKYKALRLLV
jgi:hypothetical protein